MRDAEQTVVANSPLAEHDPNELQGVTVNGIINAINEYYDTSAEVLLGKNQEDSAIKDARVVLFTLMSDFTPLSHDKIAEVTGRSQGTVSAVIRRARVRASKDPKFSQHLRDIAQASAGDELTQTLTTWPRLVEAHYEMSAEEITKARTVKAAEARQVMAHLLVEKTVLKHGAVARRSGLAASSNVAYALQKVVEKRRSDEGFDKTLAQLEEGKIPEAGLTGDDVLTQVTAYYGINREELLGKSLKKQYVQPRLMAMQIMVRELGYTYSEAGKKFKRGPGVRENVLAFEQRLEADPRLKQQRAEILNPKTAELEPASQRLMKKVCDFYGVDLAQVREERPSDRFMRPRQVMAYLMREKHGLSVREVMAHLQRSEVSIIQAHHNLAHEIDKNPLVASEVAYLAKAKHITRSINERIILRVAEATGKEPNDILNSRQPDIRNARQLAMALMAERGHLSPRDIAELFGLQGESSVYRARTVIAYRQPRDPLLTQQMEWVRQKIFSEQPATFVFDSQAAHELQNNQEVSLHSALPDIDESLVQPDILSKIYDIVEQVASFYGVPATEIIGRTDEFTINRARRMAVLLCGQSRIPLQETATCFDTRTSTSINKLLTRSEADIERQPVFAEELEAIKKGEVRRDVLKASLESVASYYHISPAELRTKDNYWANRGRTVFLLVMSEYACATFAQRGAAIGRSEDTAGTLTNQAQKRLQSNPRLRAEVQYLLNPDETPQLPGIDDILLKVRESSGISENTLLSSQLDEGRQARQITAYILADELGLPYKEIAKLLHTETRTVTSYIRQMKSKIAKNPRELLDIDSMKPQNAISVSMAGRIIRAVTERYEVTLNDLSSNDQTPQLNRVRAVTLDLMVNRAGYSIEQASQMLGIPEAVVTQLVNKL